ncbi:MAG: hypothetical protein ACQEQZ_01470 [Pseudomonadota bacterium]
MLVCSLFGLLLSSVTLLLVEQRLRYEQQLVDVMANQITNRRNLLRSLYQQLGRWPTLQELQSQQLPSGIVWSFDMVQQHPLQWQLVLSDKRWQHRLVERVGGEVNGPYWSITEPLPAAMN